MIRRCLCLVPAIALLATMAATPAWAHCGRGCNGCTVVKLRVVRWWLRSSRLVAAWLRPSRAVPVAAP